MSPSTSVSPTMALLVQSGSNPSLRSHDSDGQPDPGTHWAKAKVGSKGTHKVFVDQVENEKELLDKLVLQGVIKIRYPRQRERDSRESTFILSLCTCRDSGLSILGLNQRTGQCAGDFCYVSSALRIPSPSGCRSATLSSSLSPRNSQWGGFHPIRAMEMCAPLLEMDSK